MQASRWPASCGLGCDAHGHVDAAVDDVPLLVEALRAYAPQLDADAAVEQVTWFAAVLRSESTRAGRLADDLLVRLAAGEAR